MFIRTLGNGPPLVLIHGWAMHGGVFEPLLGHLAHDFTIHLVDLPGHGRSRGELELAPHATADALLQRVPAGAIWVGWSLGGLFALKAAARAPERIRALAAVASSPRFVAGDGWDFGTRPQVFEQFAAGLAQDFTATIERFLALEAAGSSLDAATLRALEARAFEHGRPSARALEQGLEVLQAADLRAVVGTLAMPSLWLAGRRDRMVSPAAMRWAADTAPSGRYLELDTGHMPFLTASGRVAAALRELAARAA